ncbi:uncharacterized protein C16orf52 homolog A-like [Dysidea avara]|uniref:uncharacterized protein C16orf52 homolog A-like n=1 Tax=Dysidea avara TaxID=196820 RepID=UPI0033274940
MQMYSVRIRPDVGSLVKAMDRWLLIAASFFITAEVFTVVALVSPNWITSSDDSGSCMLGLVMTCKGSGNYLECHRETSLSLYWTTCLILIIVGMVGILVTFCVLITALWKRRTEVGSIVKWISFFSTISFCFAALVFPIGFVDDEIGGDPYYLPGRQRIGYAYICFVLSILFSVLGHVFINKICFPIQSVN